MIMACKLPKRMAFALLFLAFHARAETELPSAKLPPSARLEYTVQADMHGLSLEGQSQIRWEVDAQHYLLQLETRSALTGVLLSEKSEGQLDATGLIPESFSVKRLRKPVNVTRFDRQSGQIQFAGDDTRPLQGGEQDKVSVLWQLLSQARAQPTSVRVGASWSYYVAGQRSGDTWHFEVINKQRVQSGIGEVEAWHITQTQDNAKHNGVEIWLAPTLDWFPVKLRFVEANGDAIQQTLDKVINK
jgi:hypothetical protein